MSLSDKIVYSEDKWASKRITKKPYSHILVKHVKEFIDKEWEIILKFSHKELSFLQMKEELNKLAGDKFQ